MRQRAIGAALLVPFVAIAFVAGNPWLTIGVAALALLAATEAASLIRRAGLPADPGIVILLPAAAVLLTVFAETRAITLAAPALILVCAAVAAFRKSELRTGFLAWVGGSFGAIWIGSLAFVPLAMAVGAQLTVSVGDGALAQLDGGRRWLLILLLSVWACDTFAYFAGRALPRGRMLPHLSPNKTWSGGIGGTVAGVLAGALLVALLTNEGALFGGLLGGVLAISAQAGDAAESLLKRAAGAKDSGTLIPGHGGVLDRVDSFLFAAPVLFAALSLIAWTKA